MPKQVFACEYCGEVFSTRDEAVTHEQTHNRECANPSCRNKFLVKGIEKGVKRKYCCAKCCNAAKQRAFRERHNVDFLD